MSKPLLGPNPNLKMLGALSVVPTTLHVLHTLLFATFLPGRITSPRTIPMVYFPVEGRPARPVFLHRHGQWFPRFQVRPVHAWPTPLDISYVVRVRAWITRTQKITFTAAPLLWCTPMHATPGQRHREISQCLNFADAEAAEPCTEVTHRSKRRFESTDDMAETKLLAEVDASLLTPHYSLLTTHVSLLGAI